MTQKLRRYRPAGLSDRLTRDDRRTIKIRLYELLGEQKIDLGLAVYDSELLEKLAFERYLLTTGIHINYVNS